jgi:hypothetical protein
MIQRDWTFSELNILVPCALGCVPVVLFFFWGRFRRFLSERSNLVICVCLSLVWLVLAPWAVAFVGGGFSGRNPAWVNWATSGLTLAFPVLATVLIWRNEGDRALCTAFVLVNVPGWFIASFVAGMAVSGDWI